MATAPVGFVSSTKIRSGFDPLYARAQLEALQALRNASGLPQLCEWCFMVLARRELQLKIRTRLIPFKLTRIQEDLQDKAGLRNITNKSRQIGSTTWHVLCRLLIPAILSPGTSSLLISQTKGYGAQHFRILQRALKYFCRTPLAQSQLGRQEQEQIAEDYANNVLHTQYSARHEILFDFLDSKVLVDSSENPDAGTGLTINHLVATEVAFWKHDPEALLAQAKEAIPISGTLDIESTPNGLGGYFYEEWVRAQNPDPEFRSHFYPWWWEDEYQLTPAAEKETLTEDEVRGMKEFQWTLKQIAWRRSKIISLRGRFFEKYPEDAQTCFLTSGDTFFDRDSLREILKRVETETPEDSYRDTIIYRKRIPGRRYLIGVDCAEGKTVSAALSDYSAAVVMDIDTGEEVAAYRSKQPPEQVAEDVIALAERYNNALLGIERNGPGASVIIHAQKHLRYGNIYYHKEWFREKKTASGSIGYAAGWPTNVRTRPISLNKLAMMLREAPEFWHDLTFVTEALNFVWRPKSRGNAALAIGPRIPQGAPGVNDDTVMARAIAAMVRLVQLGYWDPIDSPSERYGDMEEPEDEMT